MDLIPAYFKSFACKNNLKKEAFNDQEIFKTAEKSYLQLETK